MNSCEIESKINELETHSHFSADDYILINQWANSSDSYIRDLVATLLVTQSTDQAKRILLHLAHDEDSLVRADAYDSLSVFPCPDVIEFLRMAVVKEPNSLARSYAILSYADVVLTEKSSQDGIKTFFHTLLENEMSPRCKLSYQYALFLFGEKSALDCILSYLSHVDYKIRATTISILQEITDIQNISKIRYAVYAQRKVESSAVVKDKIDEFLKFSKSLD